MRYDVLLCDADNTLFDFDRAEELAFYSVCRKLEIEAGPRELKRYSEINKALWELYELGGITQPELRVRRFKEFLDVLGVQRDAAEMASEYMESLGKQSVLIGGAEQAVQRWSRMLPVVIITNGISRVQRGRMAGCPLEKWISGLVISEEIGAAKPDPKMIFEGMRIAGVSDLSRILVLGDSLTSDIKAAENAGADACWYNPKHKENTKGVLYRYEIDSLDKADAILRGEEDSL